MIDFMLKLIPPPCTGRRSQVAGKVFWQGMGPDLIPWSINSLPNDQWCVTICGFQATSCSVSQSWNEALRIATEEGVEGIQLFPPMNP